MTISVVWNGRVHHVRVVHDASSGTFSLPSGIVVVDTLALLTHLRAHVEPPLPCVLGRGSTWQDAVILRGVEGHVAEPLLADLRAGAAKHVYDVLPQEHSVSAIEVRWDPACAQPLLPRLRLRPRHGCSQAEVGSVNGPRCAARP